MSTAISSRVSYTNLTFLDFLCLENTTVFRSWVFINGTFLFLVGYPGAGELSHIIRNPYKLNPIFTTGLVQLSPILMTGLFELSPIFITGLVESHFDEGISWVESHFYDEISWVESHFDNISVEIRLALPRRQHKHPFKSASWVKKYLSGKSTLIFKLLPPIQVKNTYWWNIKLPFKSCRTAFSIQHYSACIELTRDNFKHRRGRIKLHLWGLITVALKTELHCNRNVGPTRLCTVTTRPQI